MEIVNYKFASSEGLKYYFTGKPCKHGHVCKRYTSDRSCSECTNSKSLIRYRKNPEKIKLQQSEYYKINTEKILSRNKKWAIDNPEKRLNINIKSVKNNPDSVMASREKYGIANAEKIREKSRES